MSEHTPRVFIARVKAAAGGGYEVWIREEQYLGVYTDAALGKWPRQKVGGGWTHERLVGFRHFAASAERLGRRAVRKAEKNAARYERAAASHRAHYTQPDREIRSDA